MATALSNGTQPIVNPIPGPEEVRDCLSDIAGKIAEVCSGNPKWKQIITLKNETSKQRTERVFKDVSEELGISCAELSDAYRQFQEEILQNPPISALGIKKAPILHVVGDLEEKPLLRAFLQKEGIALEEIVQTFPMALGKIITYTAVIHLKGVILGIGEASGYRVPEVSAAAEYAAIHKAVDYLRSHPVYFFKFLINGQNSEAAGNLLMGVMRKYESTQTLPDPQFTSQGTAHASCLLSMNKIEIGRGSAVGSNQSSEDLQREAENKAYQDTFRKIKGIQILAKKKYFHEIFKTSVGKIKAQAALHLPLPGVILEIIWGYGFSVNVNGIEVDID